jgi:hypothetical protein
MMSMCQVPTLRGATPGASKKGSRGWRAALQPGAAGGAPARLVACCGVERWQAVI